MWCVKRLRVAVLMDEAGVGFIVGSRTTRAPGDLEAHFHWHGDTPVDGQVIDIVTRYLVGGPGSSGAGPVAVGMMSCPCP